MLESMSLQGKVAIVTGSTRGIGRSIAEALAASGARVVISSRNQASCEDVAAQINARLGSVRAHAKAASISSKVALQLLVDETRSVFGPIDILVCNAASNPFYGPMSEIADDVFRKVFENNVLSNHWLIQMAVPDMKQKRDGAIIVISSIGGLFGSATLGAYHISKAADMQLVRNLAVELGPDNIRVNAIAPGVIRTDFAKALYEDPVREAAIRASTPLDRIGEPGDIAGTALLFASAAGSHITGQCLVIDGGMLTTGGL
ncbi:short-chain dehydrogenase [Sphingomonas panacis]|uniref:Short-chain dehydrogenase n=1 Tax=Sphingomonas panacis TaxID=1560345 RepID=A0A1B3Z787_9SPHN|nr:SDR family oxidoreductase [Sphingomonas panacis]AOH83291.1 short-chain dehydrogenase [Sphingomonas panacis]